MKGKPKSILRVAMALVLTVSLGLVMAVPAMAAAPTVALTTAGGGITSLTGDPTGSGTEAGEHSIVITDATASTLTGAVCEGATDGNLAAALTGDETLTLTIGAVEVTTGVLDASTTLAAAAVTVQTEINAVTTDPAIDVTVTAVNPTGAVDDGYLVITVDLAGVTNSITGLVTGANGGETETGLGGETPVAGTDAEAVDTFDDAEGSNGLWVVWAGGTTMTITDTTAAGTASTLAGLEALVTVADAFIEGVTLTASVALAAGTAVVTVSAGTAGYLAVTGATASMIAGETNELTVTAYDDDDNRATAYTGAKNLTFSGPSVAPDGTVPTVEGTDIGEDTTVNFTAGVSDTDVATLAAFAVEGTTVDVSDGTIDSSAEVAYDLDLDVVHGALAAYTVVPDTLTQEVGTAFNVDVTALDAYENIVDDDDATLDSYTFTVSGPSDDVHGTAPTYGAMGAFASGVSVLPVTSLVKAETVALTVTDDQTVPMLGTSDTVFVEGTNLDKSIYSGDDVAVTVLDGGANDPIRTDTLDVTATSETDAVGVTVTLTETGGVDTGIFTGTFPLVAADPEPGPGELAVAHGNTITVVAVDVPGATATVDMTAPVFAADTTADAEYYNNEDTITLTVTLDDVGYTVTADFSNIDNEYTAEDETVTPAAGTTYTVTYTISVDNTTADGEHTIPVAAEDDAGNPATENGFTSSVDVTLDNTGPAVTEPTADPVVIQPDTPTDVTFTAFVIDGGSGNDSITVDLSDIGGAADQEMYDDGATGGDTDVDGTYTYLCAGVDTAEDTYALTVTATDALGNANDTVDITLDVIADLDDPEIVSTLVEYPVGYESARPNETVVITVVATDVLSGVNTVTIDAEDIGLSASEDLTAEADTWSVELTVGGSVDADTYTLTITVTDFAANTATADVVVEVTFVLTGFNIDLLEGWNLISLPLIPDEPAIETVLDGVTTVDAVYSYDATTGWSSYTPGEPELSDLETMTDGKAYWVQMSAPATLSIVGKELPDPPGTPPFYSVVEGWNFIGFKSTIPAIADDYLLAIADQYTVIYSFDAVNQIYVTVTSGAADSFVPGMGYWIAVTDPGNIYP